MKRVVFILALVVVALFTNSIASGQLNCGYADYCSKTGPGIASASRWIRAGSNCGYWYNVPPEGCKCYVVECTQQSPWSGCGNPGIGMDNYSDNCAGYMICACDIG